jgi:histidinol-phosphate aminotransferase
MKSIPELVHSHLRDLEAYAPGLQPREPGWIKLNTNELPFPPPASVREAIMAEAANLARYPNPASAALRQAIAGTNGLSYEQVIVGNGSDDLLNLLARAFGGGNRTTVESFPSYSLYPVVTAIAGGQIRSVPFAADFDLPVDALVETAADLLFLTCPNAPTGIRFPLERLEELARRTPGILVIDEAYVEFSETTALPLLEVSDRVVLTRTFSKAYGLAGLRVGYAMGSPEVIGILDSIRDSYNVNRLSQAGALAALQARETYAGFIGEVKATRERVRQILTGMNWKVFPSEANFLFGAPPVPDGLAGPERAASLYEWLLARKILVRHFPKHPLTAPYLRISIGSNLEMERFIEEVEEWQKGA